MTLEEAIKLLKQYQGYEPMSPDGETLKHSFDLTDETVDALLTPLRPITREQVRRGEWEKIGADYRGQGGIWKCTACGKTYPYKCDFCPNCGAPMTDEAVDMVMERINKLLENEVDVDGKENS